jgi:GntR family transcriptional regulator
MSAGDGAAPARRAPRYLTVLNAIRAEIAVAAPNTLLPTEQALARRFGVSRLTLRRALGLLERSGLVSRRPGRGTIVSPAKVTRVLAPLYTLEEDLRGQGIPLETRVLRYAPAIEPPPDVRLALHLRRRSRVAAVELLRLVAGQVIAHDVAYVPTAFAARLRPERVGEHPLLDVLRQPGRIRLDRLDWEIEILPSEPEVAAPLGITPGMLVVASRATAYADDGVPVSRSVRCYRIDRVKFHVATRYSPEVPPGAAPSPPGRGREKKGRESARRG